MIHYFEQKYSLKLVYIETIWWWFCIKFRSSPSIWYDITKKGNSSLSRNSQEFMDQDRFWWIIGQPWSKWKRKWQTDLIPALDCIARRLGLVVEEDDVDLLGQLGHGGEDECERRDDHHRHRRERTYLRISAVNSVLWRSSDGKTTKQQVVVEEKVSFRWEWPYIKPRPTMWDRLRGKLNLRLIIGLESFNLKENLKLNNSSGTSTSKDVVSSPV